MQSPDFAETLVQVEPAVHVERTDDPAVLRWVCTRPSLAGVPSGARSVPAGGALAQLAEVAVVGAAVVARAADATAWTPVVASVHEELLAALRERAEWLFAPGRVSATTTGAVSVAAVQRVIDAAAGAVTGAHGGGIHVLSVAEGTVRVQLSGACHGCRLTEDTMRRVVEPAVRRSFPGLEVVVV